MRSTLLFASLVAVAAGACSPVPIQAPVAEDAAIWNGTPTSDFPAVGALTMDGGAFCTGTLIAPDAVLTAAHCVEFLDAEPEGDARFVTGSGAAGPLEGGVPVDIALGHPDYDGWNADIGLVFLAEDADEEPAFVQVHEMVEDDWSGEWITLVGFGITADGEDDSGRKLMTEVQIYAFDEDVFFHYTAGTNACFGDSGGPSLFEAEDGWTVLGVLSAVFPHLHDDTACVGGGGYQIRADLYQEWIEEYTEVNVEPDDDDADDSDDDDLEGDDDLDDDDGACQCRQVPGEVPVGPLTAALLAVLLITRRRGS